MNQNKIRYGLVTPAHNEAEFLPEVITTISEQTLLPEKWVIVDDRSTDSTWEVINQASQKHPYIFPLKSPGKTGRQVGANVVRVFNLGYEHIPADMDFVVKLDADLILPPDYFESIFKLFSDDPGLGMASGKTFIKTGDQWVMERTTDISVSGASKVFRHECFKEIGGLPNCRGWDTLDAAKARMRGWRTRSFADLPMYHLRPTGSELGINHTNLTRGHDWYFMRSHPLFVLAKSVFRAMQKPYFSGLLIFAGYIRSFRNREERLEDLELARFLRREQLGLLFGRWIDLVQIRPKRLK